ncbi:MAG: hypothetical protein EZS28_009633 [Streblomastix strix]|uniref:Uncharacterized protein n=1 Tax=Streblomastix strix TaxID=222440 RepID=A0A5J4WIW4_9EUKA|nr:MAG: hypothetical protein EZS28_009633 [Streblomastix strix]
MTSYKEEDYDEDEYCQSQQSIYGACEECEEECEDIALAIGATDVGLSRIKPNLKVDREGRRSKGRIESNQAACIVFVKETQETKSDDEQNKQKNNLNGNSGVIIQEFFIDQHDPTEYDEESRSQVRKAADPKSLVALRGKLVGVGNGAEGEIKVLQESISSIGDEKSWAKVASSGSIEIVCKFLLEESLSRVDINLRDIYWRLKDKESFERIISVLHQRLIFDETIWTYSLLHCGPINILKEYLSWSGCQLRRQLNNLDTLNTEIMITDPTDRSELQIFEYRPLINARTFKTSKELTIPNEDFRSQYKRFLLCIAHGAGLKQLNKNSKNKERKEIKGLGLLDEGNGLIFVYYSLYETILQITHAMRS